MSTHASATHHIDEVSPGWFWFAGILQIALGFAAIVWPFSFSLAIEAVIGIVLLIAGITQVIAAFMIGWGGFFVSLLMGVLFGAAGIALLWSPVLSVLTLTSFMAMLFLLQGILAVAVAFQVRPEQGWGMALASGIVSIFLAIVICAGLRSGASAAVLGLIFGVNMILAGAALISIARSASTQG